MSDAAKQLSRVGIKPSHQRLRILEWLASTRSHPSAEAVYQALLPQMPTLSRTTVYNTLALFVERGVAQPVYLDAVQTRYDGDARPHGHFRCRGCGRVIDVELPAAPPAPPRGYAADRVMVGFVGLCPACRRAPQAG
jgi:Fur family transcriptional regulator, peroxide stress response regulator